jgi:hypothetical protein
MWQCIVTNFLIIKPTRWTNFPNFILEMIYIYIYTCSSSVHHQELFAVHSAMVYVIQVCRQLSSRIKMELQFHPDPARKLSTNLYNIYHCCVYMVQWKTPDDGQRNCPKLVEFRYQNKIWEISAFNWFYYKETRRMLVRYKLWDTIED